MGEGQDTGSSDRERSQRLAKIDALRAAGVEPYPVRFDRDLTLGELRDKYGQLPADSDTGDRVRVAGRLMLIRRQGGLSFAELRDRAGHVQLFVDTHEVGVEKHHTFDHLDRGDIVGVEGTVMTTHTGELSVKVDTFQLLSKGIRPLPEKGKPLTDLETRYRQRYVDLIVNETSQRNFEIRIKAIDAIRQHLREQGFWEVETPVLQSIQGGATARPFVTHHNALDIDLYLRIALELHLKRLIVGGMERVFEMSRVFRNEGIDHRHNPEFTEIEVYQAYADYHEMMDLTEALFREAAQAALGTTIVTVKGETVDLAEPFRRATMVELIKEKLDVDINPAMDVDEARKVLDGLGVPYERDWGAGKMTDELYDKFVEAQLIKPTFSLDHPREVSPLARTHRSDPTLVERFELVIGGVEFANAYSELNDPVDQLERFQIEARNKAAGDVEAGDVDLDYVRALEYAMPPTGGLGVGVDRLVMLLAGVESIREIILFPTLRPEAGEGPTRGPAPRHRHVPDDHASVVAAVKEAAAAAPDGAAEPVVAEAAGRKHRRPGPVRLIAWLAVFGGLLSLIPILPLVHAGFGELAHSFGPRWFRITDHALTVLLGVALLLLARELHQQKHRAWTVAVVTFASLLVLHILNGIHPVFTTYCVVMLALLVGSRHYFKAPADPPSLLSVFRFIPIYFGAVFLAGFGALIVERNHVDPDYTIGGLAVTTLKGLVGVHGEYVYRHRLFGEIYEWTLIALGIAGLLWALYLIFRPLANRTEHTEDDWAHARRLVVTYGWDTLAYFALRDDKSFFFSSDGEAMVAYTYIDGHALAAGDPIGAAASIPVVLDEFLDFCEGRAWTPAFLAVREHDLPLYTSRGFHHVYLGDEAILHCDTFSLDGKKMKGIRQAVARVERNYEFKLMRESDAPESLIDALNAISEKWRGKNPERGFTMSLSQECTGESEQFLLAVALDERGKPGGFLRFVPAFGRDFGYTLDLMRHDPDAPNGMTEFLLSKTALTLKDEGVVRLSMNFAAWGRLFEIAPSNVRQRIMRWGIGLLNPFFQVKSLHDFNAKFSPEWLPRVIVYETRADLGRVATLYAGVEGFLAVPVIGGLFVPKTVGGAPSPDEVARRTA